MKLAWQRCQGRWCLEDQTHSWQVHRQVAEHKEMVGKQYLFIVFGGTLELDRNRKSAWSSFYSLQLVPLAAPGKGTLAVTSHPYCGLKPERCKFVCVKADLQCPHPRADTLEPLRLSWACRNSGDVDRTGMFTTSQWNQIQAARSAAAPSK